MLSSNRNMLDSLIAKSNYMTKNLLEMDLLKIVSARRNLAMTGILNNYLVCKISTESHDQFKSAEYLAYRLFRSKYSSFALKTYLSI